MKSHHSHCPVVKTQGLIRTSQQSTVYKVPPQLHASSHWNSTFDKLWKGECLQKSKFVAMQMVETPSGCGGGGGGGGGARDPMAMLMAMMMGAQGGGQTPELGEDIQQLAQKLMEL